MIRDTLPATLLCVGALGVPMMLSAQQESMTGAQKNKVAEPVTLMECETGDKCSTWTFLGTQGNGQGPTGEVENLSVEKFDATALIVHRSDSTGASAGLTADYTGTRNGNHVEGKFTSSWPGHWDSMSSKWSATIGASGATPSSSEPQMTTHVASEWNGQPASSGGNPDVIGVVEGSDHALYGATSSGLGESRYGVLYKVSSSKGFEALHVFGRTPEDGRGPSQSLFRAQDGNFYGTTAGGGIGGCGTIFRVTQTGVYTQLHSFACATEGGSPAAGSLTQGRDAMLYGSARVGGPRNAGTVYKAALTGAVTVLHSFGGPGDGTGPDGSILQAESYFYGTANTGGAANLGIAYRVTTEGRYEKLHDFVGRGDGSQPNAGFALDKAGNLFSTTTFGGAYNRGTIFKMTPSGVISILHSFSGADGTIPSAATPHMTQDGFFYGVTTYGGARGLGTLYRFNSNGVFSKLYDFDGTTGANPGAGLKIAGDGNLYGTTGKGGLNNSGVVFQLTPQGRVTPLISFSPTEVSRQDAYNANLQRQQNAAANMAAAAILGRVVLGALLYDDEF